jgi:hypothetical protein
MYYNDQTNLLPALGALNAAAGAHSVSEIPRTRHGIEIAQGQMQAAYMNLQAGLVSVGPNITEDAAYEVYNLIMAITREMYRVTDKLF